MDNKTIDELNANAPKGVKYSTDPLPNKEAIIHFKGKTLLTSYSYLDVKAYEHALAFTVAKMMDEDLLKETRDAILSAMENGTDFRDFKQRLKPYLMAKGWLAPSFKNDNVDDDKETFEAYQQHLERRLRTIYHTNLSSSYSAGQWQRIQQTKEFLPYLQYMPSLSVKKRDNHKAYYGLVRPADDPIWQSIFPPNGYGCRCWVKQLTKRQAEAIMFQQAKDVSNGKSEPFELEMETVQNPRTGEAMQTPKGVHFSFAHNHDRLTALLKLAEDKHGTEFGERLREQLKQNFPKTMTVYEQEEIIKKWIYGYSSANQVFSKEATDLIRDFDLTIPEAVAIREYTGFGSFEINAFLNGISDKDMSNIADLLRQALAKLPNYQGTVVRRTKLPTEILEQHQIGKIVEYPAFTSTTSGKIDQFQNHPHRLVIKSKHGKNIKFLSVNSYEDEVLFTSPTKFYVEDIVKGDYNKDGFDVEITLMEL